MIFLFFNKLSNESSNNHYKYAVTIADIKEK